MTRHRRKRPPEDTQKPQKGVVDDSQEPAPRACRSKRLPRRRLENLLKPIQEPPNRALHSFGILKVAVPGDSDTQLVRQRLDMHRSAPMSETTFDSLAWYSRLCTNDKPLRISDCGLKGYDARPKIRNPKSAIRNA